MMTRGTYCNPLRSLRKKHLAACLLRRLCDAHVEDIAVLVHCSPQIRPFSIDGEKDLIQVPFVATTRATTTQFIGIPLPERANTIGARFHSSRQLLVVRRRLFHIAKTEREAKREPDSVAHDFRREAETFVVGGSGACFHKAILT
jgi:hypothetical protein